MPRTSPIWNEHALRAALHGARDCREALERLGLLDTNSNRNRMEKSASNHGIDLPHHLRQQVSEVRPRGVFADDAAVIAAVTGASSYRQACMALGVSTTTKTYVLLEQACARIDIAPPPLGRNRPRTNGVNAPRLEPGERKALSAKKKTIDEVRKAAYGAKSLSEVLRRLGMRSGADNITWARRFGEVHGIEMPTWDPTKAKGRSKVPLEEYLVEGRMVNNTMLKRRLVSEGYLTEECLLCKQGPVWADKPLTLQLDHINGDSLDNRLHNLRILCPNCHSQTETYCRGTRTNNA